MKMSRDEYNNRVWRVWMQYYKASIRAMIGKDHATAKLHRERFRRVDKFFGYRL